MTYLVGSAQVIQIIDNLSVGFVVGCADIPKSVREHGALRDTVMFADDCFSDV